MNPFEHEFTPWKNGKRTSNANWRKPLAWNRAATCHCHMSAEPDEPLSGMGGVGYSNGDFVDGHAEDCPQLKRQRVFCASLADWLDPEVPAEWLADLLNLIAITPHLDWLLLTKRPELWRERMEAVRDRGGMTGRAVTWLGGIIPRNVWIGTTVEDQKRADERIPALLDIPAAVRFLSMDPMGEDVQLHTIEHPHMNAYYDLTYCAGPGLFAMRDGRRIFDCGVDWFVVGGDFKTLREFRS